MRLIIVLGVLFFASHIQADIYKWVDADGRVHYGPTPPSSVESKRLGRPTETTEEESPEEQQARLEAIMKDAGLQPPPTVVEQQPANNTVTQDEGSISKPAGLDCEVAVVNARNGVDAMLDASASSENSSEKVIAELRKVKARISKNECKAATGDTKNFYECMMDHLNSVDACAEKHKYWDASLFPKKY